jgi:hypothetical protein
MKRPELLKILCQLAHMVAEEKYDGSLPANCFCNGYKAAGFDFHPEIAAFITVAVMDKLSKERCLQKP